MPRVDLLLPGMGLNTSQTQLGLCTVALVRGRRNVLVDTSPYGRRPQLEAALRERGLTPADIHIVVLTHAHWDHVQLIDLFPKAEFALHPAELEYATAPRPGDPATPAYFIHTLRGLRVREVREGMEVETGVGILDTPGHSKGHISVLVDTPDGVVCIGGDAFTTADVVRTGRPAIIMWDEGQAEASVQKMVRASTVIYPGHDRPFRILPGAKTEYLIPDPGLQVFGILEARGRAVQVTVSQGQPQGGWIHPDALRRQ